MHDEVHMRKCLALGRAAALEGEAPVGSVVVRHGRLVAEASEGVKGALDVTAHAEVVALRRATQREGVLVLADGTLYTNVEPCVLCSYAIRRVALARVVIGAPAGTLGGVSSHHAILTEPNLPGFGPPPSVTTGVLLQECTDLLDAKASGNPAE